MIKGIDIREVWDFRLSKAVPMIDRTSGTWVIKIFAKNNPDYNPEDPATLAVPLEEHDTGIIFVEGDEYDTEKLIPCFKWLLSARDEYSLSHIEERKPVVAIINVANKKAGKIGVNLQMAIDEGDELLIADFRRDLRVHLHVSNQQIARATTELHTKIKGAP